MAGRLRPPTLAGALGGGVLLWGLAIGLRPLHDNSFLTHLATGRLILDGGIPRTDPFSFTAAGEPWTVQSWLAATAFALADDVAGGHGVQVAHAVLTTLLAAAVWRLSRPAGTLLGRLLASAAVLAAGTFLWSERPLLFGLVLLAGLVVLAESERETRWSPWVLLPAMWVWVNTHGSFPLALAYLVVRLVGRRLDGRPVDRLWRLTVAATAGTLLGALSPLGPRLLLFPLKLATNSDAFAQIAEWRSPNFARPLGLVFLATLLGSLVLLVRHPSWEDALVAAVFGALGCIAVRNVAVATIVLVPVLARGLRGLGTERGESRSVVATGTAALLALAGVLVTQSALAGRAYDLDRYPVAELAWMERQGLLGQRIATQDFVGNYLTTSRDPRIPVFIDDRYDMYPDTVREDFIVLHEGREGWQERLDRHRVTALVWERSKPLAALVALDPGWQVVHRTDEWVVAVRRV